MRRTNLAGAMRLLGASKALGCALEHLNATTFAPFPPALRALSASGSACSGGSNMALIKKLRDQSGAPISDVKKALEETEERLAALASHPEYEEALQRAFVEVNPKP